ncbi:MAG: PfkB family carbohydrate kinase [Thermoplasmata archaeon]
MAPKLRTNDRDLLIVGHVNVDRFLSVAAFPGRDCTVPVLASRTRLGGPASNIARVAASYGVRTSLWSRLGDGFPAEFWQRLRKDGIDLSLTERLRSGPTPTCYIVEDSHHGQRTFIEQGVMGAEAATAKVPASAIARHTWVHLATGNPDWYLRIAAAARAAQVRIAFDPAQEIHYRWDRRRLRSILEQSEILFGNISEIERVGRLLGVSRVERLTERVPLVIRTEGRRGASAFSRAGRVHVAAARPHRMVTLVGAGDAFRGGFYTAWFAGADLGRCVGAGTRAAARWIEGSWAGGSHRRHA